MLFRNIENLTHPSRQAKKISETYQLKQSVKVFQSLMLYLLLPEDEVVDNLYHTRRICKKILAKNSIRIKEKGSANGELTFIIEAVDSVDRGALVVSSQQEEVLGVLQGQTIKH